MVLLDWTRMGRTYCLAGAIWQGGTWRIVRPLQARYMKMPVRNIGWSPFLMDAYARWEIFELVHPQPADPQPPHLEDIWVLSLRSRRVPAEPELRRAILHSTLPSPDEPLFGLPLTTTRASAYLQPGTGSRSLSSLIVPSAKISFSTSWRAGASEPDYRVCLDVPELSGRMIPVKDHFLLSQAERVAFDPEQQSRVLTDAVRQMGAEVVVRLGLSRGHATDSNSVPLCWLMADGFFSLLDPRP